MLDDDHQLTASVGFIWGEMKRFLELSEQSKDQAGS
jgi:hypothetical protein